MFQYVRVLKTKQGKYTTGENESLVVSERAHRNNEKVRQRYSKSKRSLYKGFNSISIARLLVMVFSNKFLSFLCSSMNCQLLTSAIYSKLLCSIALINAAGRVWRVEKNKDPQHIFPIAVLSCFVSLCPWQRPYFFCDSTSHGCRSSVLRVLAQWLRLQGSGKPMDGNGFLLLLNSGLSYCVSLFTLLAHLKTLQPFCITNKFPTLKFLVWALFS